MGYLFNCSLHPGPGTCTKKEIDDKVATCRSSQCFREAVLDYEEAGLKSGPSMGQVGSDFLKVGVVGGAAAAIASAPLAVSAVRTEARNLMEQMALQAAERGAGERIMQGLIKDARFAEDQWAKMQYAIRSNYGAQSVIHYWQEIGTEFRTLFKFK
jgi:hypothetical protein